MSLFLGKIHFWLFNKVLWFEGLEDEIIKLAQEEGLNVKKLSVEINNKYGQKTENKNLEEIIDTSNIHGWLQNKIHSAEGRMAAWTKAILENNETAIGKLESVYAPVGINISSNSVDEIAFGIMAEILLVKNNGSLTHRKNKIK